MARYPYNTPRWRKVRLSVLARDGGQCMIRGPRCTGEASHVDHIVNVSDGGAPFDETNLRAACRTCNLSKSAKDRAAIVRKARGQVPLAPSTPVQAPVCRHHLPRCAGSLDYGFKVGSCPVHGLCCDGPHTPWLIR